MSLISNCPKCRGAVTVPDGLDRCGWARCPLCRLEYPVDEILCGLPPALIPLTPGQSGPPLDRDASAEPCAVAADSDAELDLELVDEPAEANVEAVEAEPRSPWTAPPDSQGPLQIDLGRTPVDADALAALGLHTADDRDSQDTTGLPARRRSRRNQKGGLRWLAEVFLGGLLGLAVAYYALSWTLGDRNGLPQLPLPLLPHTMHWFSRSPQTDELPQPAPSPQHAVDDGG